MIVDIKKNCMDLWTIPIDELRSIYDLYSVNH